MTNGILLALLAYASFSWGLGVPDALAIVGLAVVAGAGLLMLAGPAASGR